MSEILLTGFTPFAGRAANGSWIAVSRLAEILADPAVTALEIPVIWGRPQQILESKLEGRVPHTIISLGEGKPGCFQLETLATNWRKPQTDIAGELPTESRIVAEGPSSYSSSAPLAHIRMQLVGRGIPVLLSLNAGNYLCEETLYVLEHYCRGRHQVERVMFAHVPPLGSKLNYKGRSKTCDEAILQDFATELYTSIDEVWKLRSQGPGK